MSKPQSFFLILIFIAISCEVLEVADFSEYPVKIEAIELSELLELNTRFQEENENQICSTLNEFGYTGFSRILFPNNINPCLEREIIRVELNEADTLIDLAKESLLKNQEFTLVTDITDLEVDEVVPLYGCTICEGPEINSVPIEYKIIFGEQKVGNSLIRNSGITVFVDSVGVNRIWGNWFPEFTSPGLINVGYLEAQRMLIGWEINMQPFTGENVVFTIGPEHMEKEPEFEFYPYVNNGVLELRKTWSIEVLYPEESFEGWNANVDVIDGLLLTIEPIELEREF